MKRVFIIHGWEGNPEEGWLPWLKNQLEQKGFKVIVPTMPDSANPKYQNWLRHLAGVVGRTGPNDYFVGHSLGCIPILKYVESLKENEKIGGVILVAGFAHDLNYPSYKRELSSFFQKAINWEKIRKHCQKFIAIHSDDDPYVPLSHNQLFQEKLNAKSIIEHNMKHFSGDYKIFKLQSVLLSLLEISK